jgi:hypothetical protein
VNVIELHAWPVLGSNEESSDKPREPIAVAAESNAKEEKRYHRRQKDQKKNEEEVRKERSKSDPQQRINAHRNNRGRGKNNQGPRNGRYHSYSSGYQQNYRNKYHQNSYYRPHLELPDMNAFKFWIKGQM